MLIISIKHYRRTLQNINDRYDALVHLSKEFGRAKRLAPAILEGLPKEEKERLYNTNERLLKATLKAMNKYEIIISNLYRAIELASKNKTSVKLKVTKDKIILDYRDYYGKKLH